jgi:hypothetical protein
MTEIVTDFFLSIFIRIYSLYKEDLNCDNSEEPYIVRWLTLSHHLHPTHNPANTSPLHLKQLQEVSSFYFVYVYEAHQPYSFTFISSILPLTSITYVIVLSFTINSKVSVQEV